MSGMENAESDFYKKLRQSEKTLILHQSFSAALSRIKTAIEFAKNGAEPRHTLLVGESGTGKTWLAEHIESLFPKALVMNRKIIPVLLVSTPPIPTLKSLCEEILFALDDPFYYRGTTTEKGIRALNLMRSCKVECVILDEFQHFLDNPRHITSLTGVADWLKVFINEAGVPFVLIGLPHCEKVLHVNEQLRRRFSSRLNLPVFSIDTSDEERQFRTVLNEIDKALPMEKISGLAETDLARRIYFATNGLIGYVRKLITDAFEKALLRNHSSISLDLLGEAFEDVVWRSNCAELNPFHCKFPYRKLNRAGEPFAMNLKEAEHSRRGGKK
ncbi:transposase [Oxalobacteraceae bacterium CAVE-383]|nr:transposase [Oxalobacteraceae bacterium CAVE-383]